MQQLSYQVSRYWEKYQSYLPQRLRVDDATAPAEEWWQWRGMNIHIDRQDAGHSSPVKVVLLHGGGGHGRLLAPIGKLLRDQGISSVAPDLPGYGLSDSHYEQVSYEGWADLCVELVAREYARDKQPVVLFGLSLGGMLAYYVAARSEQVIGVIATTLCDPRYAEVRDAFVRQPWMHRVSLPLLSFLPAVVKRLRLPIKWFSKMDRIANTPALSSVVMKDRRGGGNRTSLNFMLSLMSARPAIEPEDFDRCPLLLAHPAEDQWTPFAASELFFRRIKGPKQLVMLENAGHIPVEEPGISQLEQAVRHFIAGLTQDHHAGQIKASPR